MPRTREELETAAAAAEQWLDNLDPDTVDWDDPADLRAIGEAIGDVAGAETALADAVAAARINGRSWGEIGQILGVSRQAARQRYNQPEVAS